MLLTLFPSIQVQQAPKRKGPMPDYSPCWALLEALTPATVDLIPLSLRAAISGIVTDDHWAAIMATINEHRK
jgi:hypothetical protein